MFSKPITPSNGKIVNAAQGQRTTEMPDAQWCEMQEITKHGKEMKEKKLKKGTEKKIIVASQNFNGFMNDSKREEISVQMKRMGIDIIVGQEGAMYDDNADSIQDTDTTVRNKSL
jgi:hypothetical protein